MPLLLQIPTDVPHPQNNSPVDFSDPFQLVIYGVIPVALIVLYFFLRKRRKRQGAESSRLSEKAEEL